MLLFAETLSGDAGWAGAGLLGLVLAWLLFKHLPDKDSQLEKLLALQAQEREQDSRVYEAIAKEFRDAVNEIRDSYSKEVERHERRVDTIATEFKHALGVILAHCDKEMSRAVDIFRKEVARNQIEGANGCGESGTN